MLNQDLTTGNVTKTMLLFAGPMIAGNLLQQCYNIADTWVVGKYLGPNALGAVGSAYTLMTFLTSIIIGLCMGSGAIFSFYFGKQEENTLKSRMQISFLIIGIVTIGLNLIVLLLLQPILHLLQVPDLLLDMMHEYMQMIAMGMFFVFLYNYFSYVQRAIGNSVVPLVFLALAACLNIVLDFLFVVFIPWGIRGAAMATVISQAVSGLGIALYTWFREPSLRFDRKSFQFDKKSVTEIVRFSFTASIQQSVMNFGILMIQGLVNSFGPGVMAAFAAAVKIDSFAYMPAQEFGNAFSLFISQNYGAGNHKRVKQGVKSAMKVSISFCLIISVLIFVLAKYLMLFFVKPEEVEIIATGVGYLRVEGAFYCGIGILFLLYGYYRGMNRPELSLILTIISLGTRVLLAYVLAPVPSIGVWGIWWAIPIGWGLADIAGIGYMVYSHRRKNDKST